jgi:tetratricopeptide (TPR) repeat protein
MQIEKLTIELSADSFNAEKNFALALEYERLGQLASAAGFYLRAAEFGYKTSPIVAYTSLLKMALCFDKQQDRGGTVITNLLEAIAFLPGRPEAYFLLSRIYEKNKKWHECYTFAELGLTASAASVNFPLPASVDYHGSYCLKFEKAVSGWWIGRKDESKALFTYLLDEYRMAPEYVSGCVNNLRLFE